MAQETEPRCGHGSASVHGRVTSAQPGEHRPIGREALRRRLAEDSVLNMLGIYAEHVVSVTSGSSGPYVGPHIRLDWQHPPRRGDTAVLDTALVSWHGSGAAAVHVPRGMASDPVDTPDREQSAVIDRVVRALGAARCDGRDCLRRIRFTGHWTERAPAGRAVDVVAFDVLWTDG